jgi:hypothetical protein
MTGFIKLGINRQINEKVKSFLHLLEKFNSCNCKSDVHFGFFAQQVVNCFLVQFIRNAAINRANSGALGLFMEALALGALVGNNIVSINADRRILGVSINYRSVEKRKSTFNGGSVGHSPLYPTFINGIVRTLGLTGTAVDTFISNLDSHNQ